MSYRYQWLDVPWGDGDMGMWSVSAAEGLWLLLNLSSEQQENVVNPDSVLFLQFPNGYGQLANYLCQSTHCCLRHMANGKSCWAAKGLKKNYMEKKTGLDFFGGRFFSIVIYIERLYLFMLLLPCRVVGRSIASPWSCFSGSTACAANPAVPGSACIHIYMQTHTHTGLTVLPSPPGLPCWHRHHRSCDAPSWGLLVRTCGLCESADQRWSQCKWCTLNPSSNQISSGEWGHMGCTQVWCLRRWTLPPSTASLPCTTAAPLVATAAWSCCCTMGHSCWHPWRAHTSPPPCTKLAREVSSAQSINQSTFNCTVLNHNQKWWINI